MLGKNSALWRVVFGAGAITLAMIGAEAILKWRLPPEREQSIPEAWAESFQRIGIRAVYPPMEDVHVGDVWAISVPVSRGTQPGAEPAPPLARGVRIWYVDLTRQIVEANQRGPTFPSLPNPQAIRTATPREPPTPDTGTQPRTAVVQEPRPAPQAPDGSHPGASGTRAPAISLREWEPSFQESTETVSPEMLIEEPRSAGIHRIRLTEVGFLGAARRLYFGGSGTGSGLFGRIGFGRQQAFVEEIRIPRAFGYGIDANEAAISLAIWCEADADLCNRRELRRSVQRALGVHAVEREIDVGIMIINYVFLTREINFRRQREDMVDGSLSINGSDGQNTNQIGANADANRSDGIFHRTRFQRPVVIGFRAVTYAPRR